MLTLNVFGFKIDETEDFKSSNPINKINIEIIKPEMYSIRPWPKGCSGSGFFEESLNPKIWIIEEAASERLLNASATIATEAEIVPKRNFAKNKIIFNPIPTAPQRTPYCSLTFTSW